MRLLELFDQPVKFEIVQAWKDQYRATFQIKYKPYQVYIDVHKVATFLSPQAYENEEHQKILNSVIDRWPDAEIAWIEFATATGKTGITGTGDAFLVLSTVLRIVLTVASQYDIEWLCFDAKEPSRIKLYQHMLRRYTKGPTYLIQDDSSGKTMFLAKA